MKLDLTKTLAYTGAVCFEVGRLSVYYVAVVEPLYKLLTQS